MSQCQSNTSRGPCRNQSAPGSAYCRLHTKDKNLCSAYRLSDPVLQEAVQYHTKGTLLDISQQIALMKSLIERRLNMAGDDTASKISAHNFVSGQLVNLTKMTETLVKLSKESGELMERNEVESLVEKMVDIVSEELKGVDGYEQIVDKIASRVGELG